MKHSFAFLPACLALVLGACSNPGSPAPGGTNNGNNGGTPGGASSSTYFFKADYNVWDKDLSNGTATAGRGSIYSYKDNGATWAEAQSLAGTLVSTVSNAGADLHKGVVGESVALSVTLDGTVFTGSATVPDALVGVTLKQGSPLVAVTPSSGTITIDPAQPLVVFWNTPALSNSASWVTVVDSIDSSKTRRVAFSDGTLTLPAGWAASNSTFTVYATNEATNLAPTDHLDAVHAYFRVNHAVNDSSDRFVVAYISD